MFIYYKLAVLVLLLTFYSQAHAGKIIGGHVAAAHSRPYMVLVESHDGDGVTQYCGGFLVNEYFVITAAHCKAKTYEVCLGIQNFNSMKKFCLSVIQDFPHEKYNEKNYRNDIMLLKLSTRANFDKNVKPIPMADMFDNTVPKMCVISGWGRTSKENKWLSRKLREVNVTLIHHDLCVEENVYCSKADSGPGEGDSGGPLVCEDGRAFGVISAKDSVFHLDKYTKIPDNRNWIDEIMKRN